MEDTVIRFRLRARAIVIELRHTETWALGNLCAYKSVNIPSCLPLSLIPLVPLIDSFLENLHVLFGGVNGGIVVLLVFPCTKRKWPYESLALAKQFAILPFERKIVERNSSHTPFITVGMTARRNLTPTRRHVRKTGEVFLRYTEMKGVSLQYARDGHE